jgi:hypothetical protein
LLHQVRRTAGRYNAAQWDRWHVNHQGIRHAAQGTLSDLAVVRISLRCCRGIVSRDLRCRSVIVRHYIHFDIGLQVVGQLLAAPNAAAANGNQQQYNQRQ